MPTDAHPCPTHMPTHASLCNIRSASCYATVHIRPWYINAVVSLARDLEQDEVPRVHGSQIQKRLATVPVALVQPM